MAAGQMGAIHAQGPLPHHGDVEKVILLQMLQQSKLGPGCCDKIFRSHAPLPPLTHTNLASFVLENATGPFAANTAIVDDASGARYSYSQVSSWVKRTAAGLFAMGVQPRDVVFILSPNCPEFVIVYLAIISLGAVAAPSNPLNTEVDIEKQLRQCDAKFVVTIPELLSKFPNCTLPTILVGDDAIITLPSEHGDVPIVECDPDDTCTLLFSSGTTGASKAVQLTHRNFMAAVTAYNRLEPRESTSESDVCLAIIPMYHVFGLGIVMLATLERGACVVSMRRYSLPAMLQCVERWKVTVATLVPPIYVVLVKSAETVARYDTSSLRILATGAAPLRADTMQSVQSMFPQCVIRQGYGMTESPLISFSVVANERLQWGSVGPLISFSVVANERLQWGSVGPLVPGTEARIVHIRSGAPLPALGTGEIWIRGPQVMKGYLNDPVQTSATVDAEGWIHTGDMGYMDAHGYLHIVDRLKEMIKYKAHQVAPGELEAVLLEHPHILDAAVVPFPDEDVGELPMAFVVIHDKENNELTKSEIMHFVGKSVASYKKVRKVEFIDAIPKSNTGKILRKELIAKIRQQQNG